MSSSLEENGIKKKNGVNSIFYDYEFFIININSGGATPPQRLSRPFAKI